MQEQRTVRLLRVVGLRSLTFFSKSRYQGARVKSPAFELFPDGPPQKPDVQIHETSDEVSLTSGSLTARINRRQGSFGIDFLANGPDSSRVLTSSGRKAQVSALTLIVSPATHSWFLSARPSLTYHTNGPSILPQTLAAWRLIARLIQGRTWTLTMSATFSTSWRCPQVNSYTGLGSSSDRLSRTDR